MFVSVTTSALIVILLLTDEIYQILSYLPEEIDFTCRICSKQQPAPWLISVEQEMQSGFNIIISSILGTKSSSLVEPVQDEVCIILHRKVHTQAPPGL